MSKKGDRKITHEDNSRSEEQRGVLQSLQERGVCNFCQGKHFLEGHPHPIILETDYWVATKNRWPSKNAEHHILVIHKKHITHIKDMNSKAWENLQVVIEAVTEKEGILGATTLLRFGDMRFNGSTVQHLHAQIVSGDGENPVLTRIG